ncbi:hypothetical protein LTR85_009808 [Meristemomyces frigidus]|nr:hypothetical protein LTR85_009808 [Meristemomyces frigidus]
MTVDCKTGYTTGKEEQPVLDSTMSTLKSEYDFEIKEGVLRACIVLANGERFWTAEPRNDARRLLGGVSREPARGGGARTASTSTGGKAAGKMLAARTPEKKKLDMSKPFDSCGISKAPLTEQQPPSTVNIDQQLPSPLLALPAELRDHIYELTLAGISAVWIGGNIRDRGLSVFYLCRQIRSEAIRILCENAIFYSGDQDQAFDYHHCDLGALPEGFATRPKDESYYASNTGREEQELLDSLVERLRSKNVELNTGVLLASLVSESGMYFWSVEPVMNRRHLVGGRPRRTNQVPKRANGGEALRKMLASGTTRKSRPKLPEEVTFMMTSGFLLRLMGNRI